MSPRVFSSLVLRELIKEIKQLGEGINRKDEKWAETMAITYSQELEEQPIVYLRDTENHRARQYLRLFKDTDVHLAERATRFIRSEHAAEIRKFLKDKHGGWPLMAEHEKVEEDHYPFPSDDSAPASFKEWFAVTAVWRLTLAMPVLSFQDAEIGTAESLIGPLPKLWEDKLDECMHITDAAAVLPLPKGWSLPLRRRDLDSVLPVSVVDTNESGLLSEGIVNSWFRILLAYREKTQPGSTVMILPDSLDVADATPQEVAEKAMMVNEDLEMILFPMIIKEHDHCILVVAFAQKKVIAIYDSLGHDSTKALRKNRPWIKENYRPKDGSWEVMWFDCPHQGDEVACGVFMLVNALFAVAIKDPADNYCPDDSMFLRRYVAAVICMGELPEKF